MLPVCVLAAPCYWHTDRIVKMDNDASAPVRERGLPVCRWAAKINGLARLVSDDNGFAEELQNKDDNLKHCSFSVCLFCFQALCCVEGNKKSPFIEICLPCGAPCGCHWVFMPTGLSVVANRNKQTARRGFLFWIWKEDLHVAVPYGMSKTWKTNWIRLWIIKFHASGGFLRRCAYCCIWCLASVEVCMMSAIVVYQDVRVCV